MKDFPLVQNLAISQYEKAAKGDVKLYPSLELVRLEKWFLKSNTKGKMLEYGFGSGCNTIHLLKCGYDIYGLDVSKNWIKRTTKRIEKIKEIKKKPKLIHLKPDSTSLPFPDNFFKNIIAMSVLSLLGKEKKVENLLKEFKRILKPNGKLIVDINDQNSVFSGPKNKIKTNIYKAKPVDKYIHAFCLKSEKSFEKIVSKFFKVKDVGFSSYKSCGKTITEFIICGVNNKR